ncbi:MAG: hypothetical protein U1E76_26095 [Planctomycetota bacterium]
MVRGFALHEALIAVAIIALALLGVSQVSLEVKALRRARDQRQVAEAAIDRELDVLRAMSFAQLPDRDGTPFDFAVDVNGDHQDDPTLVRVSQQEPNLLGVEVTVSWGSDRTTRHAREFVWVTDRRGVGG